MESENQETEAQGEVPQTRPEPVAATPGPARAVLPRRLFILGGFWSTLALAVVGLTGPSLDFWWPRTVAGAARKVFVSSARVPKVGDGPVAIPEGRFFLVNLAAGTTPNGEGRHGGRR